MLCLWIAKGLKAPCNLVQPLPKKTPVACPKVCAKDWFNGPMLAEANTAYPHCGDAHAHRLSKDDPAPEAAAHLIFLWLSSAPPHSKALLESKHWELWVKYFTISTIKTSDS